ncbi:uncharacterized protein F4812DRAFT_386418 [Daldinia caldariorum]|uniref:uncharacterized protein n=1 Tax=Daldinia caldariorum TaxID=326644 RepID=UPI0020081CD3|nr:uncharacterized protein F4812DRAFT_386418 [Daldinia caldariorum]KAI1467992.1 hypothetical protein F4812DRAFT_386418 [Daldinia caldariorum]
MRKVSVCLLRIHTLLVTFFVAGGRLRGVLLATVNTTWPELDTSLVYSPCCNPNLPFVLAHPALVGSWLATQRVSSLFNLHRNFKIRGGRCMVPFTSQCW